MVLCDDTIGHVTRGSLGGGGGEEEDGKAATQHNLVTSPGRRLCGSLHAHTPLQKT